MIIVEQGRIVEACAEPGEFTLMLHRTQFTSGNLDSNFGDTLRTIADRIAYGGDTGKDQRVHYFNIKELVGNKFGTPTPVPFRVVDQNIGLDIDISVRCNGIYFTGSPIRCFYANVCGNVREAYTRAEIDSQLGEFMSALQPAFAKISTMGIRYSDSRHTELCDAMNEVLTSKWAQLRGLSAVSVAINSITASKEDEDMIGNCSEVQSCAIHQWRRLVWLRQSEAMKAAATNNGSMAGFAGFGMAQQAGGVNAQDLYRLGVQQAPEQPQQHGPKSRWTCSCGTENDGRFAASVESPSLEEQGWVCSLRRGQQRQICSECGKPRPAGALLYRCDKCGWEPKDPQHPPKFCPECGDPLTKATSIESMKTL
ncbi:MAG: SPFH domain-containing protein [[Clostridium] leptum]